MARKIDILRLRLANQRIGHAAFREPDEAVAWFGAVQAQDYLGALWALGLRTRGATEASVEAAEARRAIVRTWPLRGTLHFVAAADARWITRLAGPRILARHAGRWERDFGVTPKLLARADDIVTAALEGGRRLTRERLYGALEAKRIRTGASRGLHLLLVLALRGRICLAGRDGKQQTFALLDEWIPRSRNLEGDAALAELALRYFASHGPATQRDFMWWSGATSKQAAAALDGAGKSLARADLDGTCYWWRESGKKSATHRPTSRVRLLPAFDEYTVAYQDRSLLVDGKTSISKMGLLNPAILVDGKIAGTWKRTVDRTSVTVTITLWRKLAASESQALQDAVRDYGEFLRLEARLEKR